MTLIKKVLKSFKIVHVCSHILVLGLKSFKNATKVTKGISSSLILHHKEIIDKLFTIASIIGSKFATLDTCWQVFLWAPNRNPGTEVLHFFENSKIISSAHSRSQLATRYNDDWKADKLPFPFGFLETVYVLDFQLINP